MAFPTYVYCDGDDGDDGGAAGAWVRGRPEFGKHMDRPNSNERGDLH